MRSAIEFVIPGKLVAKQSCRFTMRGVRYTDASVRDYQSLVRICAAEAMCGEEPWSGPVTVRIVAYLPIPESWSRKRQEAAARDGIMPTVKPDEDNITKGIHDACEGVVFVNDKQVIRKTLDKYYGRTPMTKVYVAKGRVHIDVSEKPISESQTAWTYAVASG